METVDWASYEIKKTFLIPGLSFVTAFYDHNCPQIFSSNLMIALFYI